MKKNIHDKEEREGKERIENMLSQRFWYFASHLHVAYQFFTKRPRREYLQFVTKEAKRWGFMDDLVHLQQMVLERCANKMCANHLEVVLLTLLLLKREGRRAYESFLKRPHSLKLGRFPDHISLNPSFIGSLSARDEPLGIIATHNGELVRLKPPRAS